jgi:hypothetical protein
MNDESNELNNCILAEKHVMEKRQSEAIKEECLLEAIIDRRVPQENFETEDKSKSAGDQGPKKD